MLPPLDPADRLWMATGWTMLHFLGAGSLIGLVALVGRVALRRSGPDLRYGFALACLAALAIAPVPLAARAWGDLAGPVERTPQIDHPAATPPAAAEPIVPPDSDVPGPAPAPAAPAAPRAESWRRYVPSWSDLARALPAIWLAGAPATLAMVGLGLIGTSRLRASCRPIVDGPIAALCRRLAGTARVSVAVCDRLGSPVLLGIARPVVLLPAAAVTGWSADQLEMVLRHELEHARRHDNLVNLIQRLIEAALFFHPAVWMVSRWVRVEREQCCDRAVVTATARPRAYAEALAALAMPGVSSRFAVVAMADGRLVGRIRRILDLEDDGAPTAREALVGLGMLAIAPLVGLAGWARMAGGAASTNGPSRPADPWSETVAVEPLRYRWRSGQTLSYALRLDSREGGSQSTTTGTVHYRVVSVADGVADLDQIGGLDPPSPVLLPIGPPHPPLFQSAIRNPQPPIGAIRLRMDAIGRPVGGRPIDDLPDRLGDLAGRIFATLDDDGASSWRVVETATIEILSAPIDAEPAGPPGFPTRPPFLGPPPVRRVVHRVPARSVATYRLGPSTTGRRAIRSRIERTTRDRSPADGPAFRLDGRGELGFAHALGLPIDGTLTAMLDERTGPDAVGRRVELVLSWRLATTTGLDGPIPSREARAVVTRPDPGDESTTIPAEARGR